MTLKDWVDILLRFLGLMSLLGFAGVGLIFWMAQRESKRFRREQQEQSPWRHR